MQKVIYEVFEFTPQTLSIHSFMSAISLMGLTREIYMYGTQFIAINIGYIVGTPLSAYVFLPVFFRYTFNGSSQTY